MLCEDPEQSTIFVHLTKTSKVGELGYVTEATEESSKFNFNWKDYPVIDGSFEEISILKVLFRFLDRTENPAGAVKTPIGVIVPVEVLLQKLGVITQAGMVRIVISVMKYVIEL